MDRTRRALVLDEAVGMLTRTPATLDAWLRDLPDGWANGNEGGDTWSPADVVAHLTHTDRTNWVPRVTIILQHGEARAFDEFDRFGHLTGQAGDSAGRPPRRVRGGAPGQPAAARGARAHAR